MALTPVGFPGQVDAVQDAKRSQFQGALFPVVGNRTALLVTINSAATLTCAVAVGTSFAHGVMATLDNVESVTFDPVTTSGATRWDAVVIRRTWGNTAGTSSAVLFVVKGTAAAAAPQVLPAGLNNIPGTVHDQVLALVQISYGSTIPSLTADMRLYGSKVFAAPALAALPAASNALFGAEAVLPNGTRYRCVADASNATAWVAQKDDPTVTEYTGTAVLSASSGWSVASPMVNRCLRGLYWRQVDLEFSRTGAQLNSDDATGDAPNTDVATLTALCRPDRDLNVPFTYRFGTDPSNLGGGMCILTSLGKLTLYSFNNPGKNLIAASGTEVSLRVSLHFGTKGI